MFKTRIYHCNVDTAGNLSVEILRDSWSPALTITKVLQAIRSIFLKPETCKSLLFSHASYQISGQIRCKKVPLLLTYSLYIFVLLLPDNPALPVIARLYLSDREKHEEVAKEWTLRFAK